LAEGLNFVWARDFQPAGWTSPFDAILRWSKVEYTILIPAAVGYGDVFANQTVAIEDARQRLIALLESYDVEFHPADVRIDQRSTAGLRWLWGPSLIKVIVWEK
jgi:hypothetical protein